MGIKDRDSSLVFLFEGLILGVFGAIGGVLLGLGLSYAFTTFALNADGTPVVPLSIEAGFIALSALIALIASMAAALIPARKSSRLSVIEVIRNAYIVELKNITKIYGEKTKFPTQVLFGINLEFPEGSFNSIIGQSGSGKSTLLNILGTLENTSGGSIFINNKETSKMNKLELAELRNETIGFIFQFHYLLPEFTALENVLMPFRISKKPLTRGNPKTAEELLDLVGLAKFKRNLAVNMSGGQQQRVAIARSLMNNPKLILADEPTGNLDSDSTEQVLITPERDQSALQHHIHHHHP
jgi:lipoprotein-releasing system ATP-binding protein